jgi:hypothetical protein
MPPFPEIHVGDLIRHEALAVFPLYSAATGTAEYLLSDEALAAGSVTVEEMNDAGSVPNLVVANRARLPVLFLEGEELRGAKQNRVLNTSVLVAAMARTSIPVSCVEAGRWRYVSRHFGTSGHCASSKLRHILKGSVSRSARAGHGHGSDQGEVWKEVGRQMAALGSASPTAAMADTYETYRHRLDEFRDPLRYVDGATGLAVAVGGKLVSMDLFDRPATCRKVWDRLLAGVVMDALEAALATESVQIDDVRQAVVCLRGTAWQEVAAVGSGEEFRSDTDNGRHASALVFEGSVVHGSLVLAG